VSLRGFRLFPTTTSAPLTKCPSALWSAHMRAFYLNSGLWHGLQALHNLLQQNKLMASTFSLFISRPSLLSYHTSPPVNTYTPQFVQRSKTKFCIRPSFPPSCFKSSHLRLTKDLISVIDSLMRGPP